MHSPIPIRFVVSALSLIIGMHFLLSYTHEPYGRATALSQLKSQLQVYGTHFPAPPNVVLAEVQEELLIDTHRKANATLLMLARNTDVDGVVQSMRSLEDRFNRKFQYPWVFLNEEPFTEDFKRRVSVLTDAPIEFGLIPHDQWHQPMWVDEERAAEGRQQMDRDGIIYGGSLSYRNMCRFNSGFFYRHALLQKYRYYWRVEPDVKFHCDVGSDPFLVMERENKVYGFTIALYEYEATIKSLWSTVVDFVRKHPQYLAKDSALAWLSDDLGATYNLCHFWSNFEIADMDFWRGEAYTAFFDFLDEAGGFYYERWGDAPVHSIAAALFASKDQLHFFEAVGYEHAPFTHCPVKQEMWEAGRCGCAPEKSFDLAPYSCINRWHEMMAPKTRDTPAS